MPYDKLYIKITCTHCHGSRKVQNNRVSNYASPTSRWTGCKYCDPEGTELIEAADKTIVEFLKQLPESRLKKIIENIE
tara:strand:+ start:332 stop:565 length:234 start_codon:yes stop_codon:yes gene_type:complete